MSEVSGSHPTPALPDFHLRGRPLRVGIIVSELFAPGITAIGGFGWAARLVSRCFSAQPELGVRTVFLMTRPTPPAVTVPMLHGSPVLWRKGNLAAHLLKLRRQHLDVLLAIDHQSIYRVFYWAFPRTPIILWARDPWSPENKRQIATLRIPGDEASTPQGIFAHDHSRSFRRDYVWSQRLGRRIVFAVPSPFLAAKIPGTFGVEPGEVPHLPNIFEPISRSPRLRGRASFSSDVLPRSSARGSPWSWPGECPRSIFCFSGRTTFPVRAPGHPELRPLMSA